MHSLAVIGLLLVSSGLVSAQQRIETTASAKAVASVASPTRDSIHRDAKKFFSLWQSNWRDSQTRNWPATNGKNHKSPVHTNLSARQTYVHCHWDSRTNRGEFGQAIDPGYVFVRSSFSEFSVCPTWILGDIPTTEDESLHEDAGIHPALRDKVRAARSSLIGSLERVGRARPEDKFFVGQHVRFLLDQELPDSALDVAKNCRAERWWCLALQGYVEHRLQGSPHAESTFAAAYANMPVNVQCEWRDIIHLLPEERREVFGALSCAQRILTSEQYWWLADPLYSEPGNERRVVHEARSVRLLLQSALPMDGRVTWKFDHGSDAFARLIMKYGWPAYLGWGGMGTDASHNRWLRSRSSAERAPYTTYEYSPGRLHTGPSIDILDNPLSATDSSWAIDGAWRKSGSDKWWPEEHFRRARGLVPIPPGQIAMMRRADNILLATAHDLKDPQLAALENNGTATLFSSANTNNLNELGRQQASADSTVFMRANIANVPTLLALEISNPAPTGIDARRRIGLAPPAPLNAMRPGEVAISEPAILRPYADSTNIQSGDSLLNNLLGTTIISLKKLSRMTVYWETYGFHPRDSVSVAVSLERRNPVGAVRRIGMALRLADNPNSSVNISWREPDFTKSARTIEDVVPVQIRTVTLDISNISPGEYDVVTSIAREPQPRIASRRRITIVP